MRRARYNVRTGQRARFDENKVKRKGGRFAEKPGAGDENFGPVKTSGINRNDRIESLAERSARLNGLTVGEVMDRASDPQAVLRALAARHRDGQIQFREGKGGSARDEVEVGYLGQRYPVENEEVHAPERDKDGVADDDEREAGLEAIANRIRSDRIVLTAPIRSGSGEADADQMREELLSSYDTHRNKPSWLSGEAEAAERKAVEEAVDDYVERNAKLYTRDYDDDDLVLTISRPSDSPYWKAREGAEVQFRKDGLTRGQIDDELSGAADQRRENARQAAGKALSDASYEATSKRLREAFPDEMRAFEAMSTDQGRERFIARSRLLARFKKERGIELAYA